MSVIDNLPGTRKTFDCANSMEIIVDTNSPKGGDGSRSYIEFRDDYGTSQWDVNVDGKHVERPKSVRLEFTGDSESAILVEALKFAIKVLEINREIKMRTDIHYG